MTLGYLRSDMVLGLKGQKSRLELVSQGLGLTTAMRRGFELSSSSSLVTYSASVTKLKLEHT